MRILVIDDEALAEVKRVRDFALAHRCNIHEIMRNIAGGHAPGIDPNRFLELMDGWKVVYTIDQTGSGWLHHVSISVAHKVPTKKLAPSIHGSTEILKLFGLPGPLQAAHIYLEELPTGNVAVNLIYPFSEP